MLLCGNPTIEVSDIFTNCTFAGGFSSSSPVYLWLQEVLYELDAVSLARFLAFVTGCATLPVDGLKPPLMLTRHADDSSSVNSDNNDNNEDSKNLYLPVAHTCFNQIVLPEYSSKEILSERLLYALNNATDGFFIS